MRALIGILILSFFSLGGSLAFALEKVEAPESCVHCGMDRTKFAHSRMIVEYDDGTSVGLCSLNCAVIDMDVNKGKKVRSVLVADYNSKKLVDAEKAFWVIGGEKKGVMTMTPKWAFEKKDDAETFMKTNQGKAASFEEVMKMAYEDMYEDTKMIREKRKMKRMKMMEQKS